MRRNNATVLRSRVAFHSALRRVELRFLKIFHTVEELATQNSVESFSSKVWGMRLAGMILTVTRSEV